jgi:thioesterase domain-containing protein
MLFTFRQFGLKPPLVLIHGSEGGVAELQTIADHIDSDRPIYGIQSQACDKTEPPILSIEDLAFYYIREMDNAGILGPIALLGYSFGGLVAFEIARQLQSRFRPGVFLGLLDTWLPAYLSGFTQPAPAEKTRRRSRNIQRHLRNFVLGPERRRYFRETVISKIRVKAYGWLTARNQLIPSWFRNLNDLNLFAGRNYRPQPYDGDLVLFLADDEYRDERYSRDLGWGCVTGSNMRFVTVPGNHRSLVHANAIQVAQIISETLAD